MTEEKMRIDVNGNIDFEVRNHSEKKDVCIMCSTLKEMLISACELNHIDPEDIYEAEAVCIIHIRGASYPLVETFRAAHETYKKIADQFPFFLKIK
jgi:hypothetical protein